MECGCDFGEGSEGSPEFQWELHIELTLSAILFHADPEALEQYLETDRTPRWRDLKDVLDLEPFQNYREHCQNRKMVALAGLLDKNAIDDYYHRYCQKGCIPTWASGILWTEQMWCRGILKPNLIDGTSTMYS
ncbi:hypothetical protein ES703_28573 [subsurface metagenome]